MLRKILVSKLVWDTAFYPREDVNSVHVTSLVEALKAGFKLPPIVVEEKTLRIVDGVHSWKAVRKLYGDAAKIECDVRRYKSEADLYTAAIELNSDHGLRYTAFEQTKCILKAQELGITREIIAHTLRITEERIERIIGTKTAIVRDRPVPLKASMARLHGCRLTRAQQAANKYGGGMQPLYYIRQLKKFILADLAGWGGQAVLAELTELRDLLAKKLAV